MVNTDAAAPSLPAAPPSRRFKWANLRLIGYYWRHELQSRPQAFAFRLLLLAAIFSALLSFALFLPVYEYWRLSPYLHSAYDFYVNGPITESHYQEVSRDPSTEQVAVAWRVSPMIVYADGKMARGNPLLHVFDRLPESEQGWLPQATRLSGQIDTYQPESSAVVSYRLAQDLDLQVGDTITMPLELLKTTLTYTIAAIHEPAEGGARELVAVERTPRIQALLAALDDSQLRGHDLFVVSSNPQATRTLLEEMFSDEQALLFSRADQIANQQASIEYRPPVVVAISLLGLLGYLVVLWRDAQAAFTERSRNAAILHALGMTPGFILGVIMLEQMILGLVVVGLAGIVAAGIVYSWLLGYALYLPASLLWQALILSAVVHVIVVALLAGQVRWRLQHLPVSRLLAPEIR